MFEDDTRIPIFTGAFLLMTSLLIVIIGIFYLKGFDDTITRDHFEISIGWLSAIALGLLIAWRFYTENNFGSSMSDGEGDSVVAFVAGLSVALYALMATWLSLAETPGLVIAFGLISSALVFIGIALIFNYLGASSSI